MNKRNRFRDRADAGADLARVLQPRAGRGEVVVLALPRGGVPVAFAVARSLRASLDVFVVRKLGVPGHEEYAMGAIASGGVRVLNRQVVMRLENSDAILAEVTARETTELQRRETAYRCGRPPAAIQGRTVILIDDGLATGASMRAAIAALRGLHPKKIIAAIPVGAESACKVVAREADELICLLAPEDFQAVGEFYDDFSQTTDDEVRDLLEAAQAWLPAAATA